MSTNGSGSGTDRRFWTIAEQVENQRVQQALIRIDCEERERVRLRVRAERKRKCLACAGIRFGVRHGI